MPDSSLIARRAAISLFSALDDSRIRRELGYEPRIPFGQGITDTVAWYRDNPDWWKPLKDPAAVPAPA